MTEARDAALQQVEDRHNLYKRFFDSGDGRDVLADLERLCYFKGTMFSVEPGMLAYREGMRNVLLHIKTMIELDTEAMKDAINKNKYDEPLREEEI